MFGRRLGWIGSVAMLLVFLFGAAAAADDCDLVLAVQTASGDWKDDPCPPFKSRHWDHRREWEGWDDDDDWDWDDAHGTDRLAEHDRYAIDFFGDGFGVKTALGRGKPGWQFAYAQTDSGDDDLEVQLSLVYRIPESFLVWHFYGGGGVNFALPEGSPRPFFLTGTELLFLFWEHGYLFGNEDDRLERFHRGGIRIRF